MSSEQDDKRLRDHLMLGGATAFLAVFPFSLMFAPVPLAALVFRHGLQAGIAAALVAGALALLMTQSPIILAQVLLVLALGVALGEGLRDGLSATQIVGLGTLVALATTALMLFAVQRVLGVDIVEMIGRFWEEALRQGAGNTPEQLEAARRAIELQKAQMRISLPASLALGSLATTVVDFALVRWLLARLGEEMERLPKLRPFGLWRFPLWVAAVYACARLCEIAVRPGEDPGAAGWAIANALMISGALLAVQGAAVLWHFLARLGVGVRLLAFITALLLFQYIAVLTLLLLGIVDAFADLRRRFGAQGAPSA